MILRNRRFAFEQRKISQVAVVQIQQIEGVEDWATSAKEKFVEYAPTFRVQTNEFAIEDSVLDLEFAEAVA